MGRWMAPSHLEKDFSLHLIFNPTTCYIPLQKSSYLQDNTIWKQELEPAWDSTLRCLNLLPPISDPSDLVPPENTVPKNAMTRLNATCMDVCCWEIRGFQERCMFEWGCFSLSSWFWRCQRCHGVEWVNISHLVAGVVCISTYSRSPGTQGIPRWSDWSSLKVLRCSCKAFHKKIPSLKLT